MKKRLWNPIQISLGTYAGGPITGCYFLGKNYQLFGRDDLAKRCYIFGFLGMLALIASVLWIPEDILDTVPRNIVPIIYTSFVSSFAFSLQQDKIKELIKEGNAKRYSYFYCILMVLSLLVVQSPLLLFLFL